MTSTENIHHKFKSIFGSEYKKKDLYKVCASLCKQLALPIIGKNPIETVRKNWGDVCNGLMKMNGHQKPKLSKPKPQPRKGILTPEQEAIMEGRICPYCKAKTEYVDSAVVYGTSYGMIYLCRPCGAWVGVHLDEPLKAKGRLANHELREWKKKAHEAFDPIWKSNYMNRHQAYSWLSKQLGIPAEYCHIGMMGLKSCKRLVEICKKELT